MIPVMAATTRKAKLKGVTQEAEDICVLEFGAADGAPLAPFSAGAHIDLHLANGLVRSYSLVNSPTEHHRYVIGVKKEAEGRGGSRFIHEQLHVGDVIEIGVPRNNFSLREEAGRSVLIAGGIGVTPLACMSRRLEELGKPWELHYAARDRSSAGFVPQLGAFGPKVNFYFPTEFYASSRATRIDIADIVHRAPPDAHIYCCGPRSMLSAFEAAVAGRAADQIHVEFFSNTEPFDTEGGFEVMLAKSGETIEVPSGKTILDVLLARGIDAPYSCLEGVCSSCETRVISGIPEHRDLILTTQERAAGDRMMICCSRSKSRTLVLDL
jgi:ferredoxin-NADP reductase